MQEFDPRHFCAFESATLHNPNSKVLVLLGNNSRLEGQLIPQYIKDELPNLSFHYTDFGILMEDTPIKELWDSGRVQRAQFLFENLSDVLRLVI